MIDYKNFEARNLEIEMQRKQTERVCQFPETYSRAKLSDMLLTLSNHVRNLENKWENRPRLVIRLESRTA